MKGMKCVSAAKELELAALRFKCRFHVMKKHNMLKMMKHHKSKKCMKHRNEADVAGRRDGRTVRFNGRENIDTSDYNICRQPYSACTFLLSVHRISGVQGSSPVGLIRYNTKS